MNTIERPRRRLAALTALAVTAILPALALAQEFVKVEGKAGEEVPAGPFVAIAYGFIWIAVLAYVVFIARGLGACAASWTSCAASSTPPASAS